MTREGNDDMEVMKLFNKLTGGAVLATAFLLLSGCGSPDVINTNGSGGGPRTGPPPAVLGVGDLVIVTFSGVEMPPPQHEERVKEDGTVTLSLIGSVMAKGKTSGDLQRDIRAGYVPKFYTENFNVIVKSVERFYFVGGEVRGPSRQLWAEGMTVVKAIQTAGDFTDFAKKTKVRLTRTDGRTVIVNCNKAIEDSKYDLPVYPGDRIDVPRRSW